MQSAAAQLIVVCKVSTISLAEAENPNYLPPPLIPMKPNVEGIAHGAGMKRHEADGGGQHHRQCNQPYLLMIGVRHKIVGMGLVEW